MRKYRIVVLSFCILAMAIPSATMAGGYRATVLDGPNWTPWDDRINELFETVNGLCSSTDTNDPIWFCGEGNLLMKKDGDDWYDYSGGSYGTCTDPLYDVAVNIDNPNNVVAVGYDMRAITFDGGNTWRRTCFFYPHPDVARSIVYDYTEECFLYCRDNGIVGYGGTSNPPFGTWFILDYAWYPLRGVAAVLDLSNFYSIAVAVGNYGKIYYAEDYTSGFSELIEASVSPGTSDNFNAVDFCWTGSPGVAVGDNGTIYYSTDHGRSWLEVFSTISCNLHDVSFNSGIATAVGDNGVIVYAYTSNIDQWYYDVSNTDKDLFALSDQNDFSLIAAGEKYAMSSIRSGLDDLHTTVLSEEEIQGALQVVSVYGTGAAQLRYTPHETEDIQIVLFDISGRVVHESRHSAEIGTEFLLEFDRFSSDAGGLPNGLYSCLLREGNTYFTDTFVISR